MLHITRTVAWLAGLASGAWCGFLILFGLTLAHLAPSLIDINIGIVAVTLTVIAVQLDNRGAPAKEYRPTPLRVIRAWDEPTLLLPVRPAGQIYQSWPPPVPSSVPRRRVPVESAVTAGNDRAYFKAFEEISQEVLGERDDDPPSAGAETVQ